MPRFPSLSAPTQVLPASILDRLKRRAAEFRGPVIPLHIGDTHLAPPEKSRLGALGFSTGRDADLYRYSPPPGKQALLEALVVKLHRQNRILAAGPDNVQVTVGATHGLACAIRALLDPGEHILLPSPYWPHIRGIAIAAGVRPIEAPFTHVLLRRPGADPEELLEELVTPETGAIYLSTPNNPDGKVLTPDELAKVARVAERHHLWVLSDEVYEDLVHDGRIHTSIASLPGMAGRTVTLFSFSKSFGQAGLRVGYAVGPAGAMAALRKMSHHTVYCVPRAMQRAALMALETGAEFLAEARALYQATRDAVHARLGDLCLRPEGSTYLFLDLSRFRRAGEADALGALERIADAGVLLAPGAAFGHDYGDWARLCFTSVDRPALDEAVDRIIRVLHS
ncbi:MAG TPA: pyridoxal phosphate-dependent aminotransferase [Kofleriaceae bacterium]|nr:pyridoxal phosphate-dependent aminotransferase [Kofleriaceae bacterium]